MSNKFIITGFPRSRTAWLSALFCSENVICLHEPINNFISLDLMKMYVDELNYEYVGISDSSIALNHFFYISYFSQYPVVIVNRDKKEVADSLLKITGLPRTKIERILNMIEFGLNEIRANCNVLDVDYNDLDEISLLKLIAGFCTPNVPLDEEQCKVFRNFYITQHTSKLLAGMEIQDEIFKNIN